MRAPHVNLYIIKVKKSEFNKIYRGNQITRPLPTLKVFYLE